MEQEDLEIEAGLSFVTRPDSKNLVHFFYNKFLKAVQIMYLFFSFNIAFFSDSYTFL